jgi:MFS family permease
VGFLLGAAVADRVIARIGLGLAIVIGACVAAGSFLLIAVPPPSLAGPFIAAGMFVYGLGALTFTVGNATLRQLTVPGAILGRVTSSMRLLVWIAQPVAGLAGGWLGSRIGLHHALWIGAVGALSAPTPLLASGLVSVRRVPDVPSEHGAGS